MAGVSLSNHGSSAYLRCCAGLSVLGSVVYVGVWVFLILAVVISISENRDMTLADSTFETMGLIAGVGIGLGIVGFGLSLSSVVSKFKPKFAAWTGLIFGAFLILAEILLNILNVISS